MAIEIADLLTIFLMRTQYSEYFQQFHPDINSVGCVFQVNIKHYHVIQRIGKWNLGNQLVSLGVCRILLNI